MEKSWCEVCQYGAKAETLEELMQIWKKHTSTPQHVSNVIKHLMIDTGAKTLDETIPS